MDSFKSCSTVRPLPRSLKTKNPRFAADAYRRFIQMLQYRQRRSFECPEDVLEQERNATVSKVTPNLALKT